MVCARVVSPQMRGPNPDNLNSGAVVASQFGLRDHCRQERLDANEIPLQCVQEAVAIDVLEQLFSEPAFNVLRTQEQLGYVVFGFEFVGGTWVTFGSWA